jgi:exodeoxyribonuclease VII large subunit
VQAASAAGRARAERAEAGLRAMNPLAVLQRGYSITWGADGRAVRSATGVRAGERVTTQLADGRLVSDVVETVIEKRRRQA